MSVIDVQRVQAKYRRIAVVYDRLPTRAFEQLRRWSIGRLPVEPGATVLDIGCGTGASFAALQEVVRAEAGSSALM